MSAQLMMQSSNDTSVLTDLCAICHVNPLKYTCPRCGIHTCSLPCVKRHKQWAQCSGIRDPAAYRKRSELATASSIDQDFNFITNVERSLQRADDQAKDHGVQLVPSSFKRDNKSKIELEIESRKINWIRAPQGLSRSKQNKSHWAGQHKCIMWTIEWLCENDNSRFNNTLESKTVGEAYINTLGKKSTSKRKRNDDNRTSESKKPDTTQQPQTQPTIDPTETQNEPKDNDQPLEKKSAETQSEPKDNESPLEKKPTGEEAAPPTAAPPSDAPASNPDHSLLEGLYFYLHKPRTKAKLKCLIPISSSSSIYDIVSGQTILEFPTIYVKDTRPEDLVEPFITEEEYLARFGEDVVVSLDSGIKREEGLIVSNSANNSMLDDS